MSCQVSAARSGAGVVARLRRVSNSPRLSGERFLKLRKQPSCIERRSCDLRSDCIACPCPFNGRMTSILLASPFPKARVPVSQGDAIAATAGRHR